MIMLHKPTADECVRWNSSSLPEDKLVEVFLESEWVHSRQDRIVWFWANMVWPCGSPRDAKWLHVKAQSERVRFDPRNGTNKLWFVASWATMNNANQNPKGQSIIPTPELCSRGTSESTDGHKFGQLSDGWCNHRRPNHHRSCFSNISGAKSQDAQSAGLVCVGTWCQETSGNSDWTVETRLATNVFVYREEDCFSQISAIVESIQQ